MANEYSFSLIAEIGSLDKATLNRVIQEAKKEWDKNGKFKLSFRVDEETGNVIRRIGAHVKEAGEEGEKAKGKFNGFFSSLSLGSSAATEFAAKFSLIDKAITFVQNTIKSAIKDIQELNKVMTNVQMVAGASGSKITNMFGEYNEIAKDLGVTTKYVAEGADSWLRQGKSATETNELLRASTMQAKIANIEAAQSTEYLTSTLNGYQMSADNAMHVVDALTAVDFSAATSVDELAVALQKTANSARDAGVPFERLVGYIAAISENTRLAPEIIGTSFRTLFSRMENVKAGKSVDEYGDSLNDVEKVLNRFDIKLRDTQNEFRDMQDVLDDVYASWDNLSSVERAQISTSIAGVRQREVFISLMDNYDKALKYNEIALNSNGSAAERYSIYMDNLEARVNDFKSTWESIIYNKDTQNFFKNSISFATDLSKELPKIIVLLGSAFAVANPGLAAVVTAIGAIIGNWDKIKAFFTGDKEFYLKENLESTNSEMDSLTTKLEKTQELLDELEKKKIDGIVTPEEQLLVSFYRDEINNLKSDLEDLRREAGRNKSLLNYTGVTGIRSASYKGGTREGFSSSDFQSENLNISNLQEAQNAIAKLDQEIEASNFLISEWSKDSNEKFKGAITGQTLALTENQNALARIKTSLIPVREEILATGVALEDMTDDEQWVIEMTDGLVSTVSNLGLAAQKVVPTFGELLEKVGTLTGNLEVLKSDSELLTTAFEEMSNSGEITAETAAKLIGSFDDIGEALIVENGVIKVNTDLLREKFDESVQGYILTREEAISSAEAEVEAIQKTIDALKVKISLLDLATRYGRATNLVLDNQVEAAQAEIDSYLANIDKLKKEIGILSGIDIGTFGSSSSKSSESAAQKKASAYVSAITKQLDKEMDVLKKEQDHWKEYYDNKISGIKDTISALEEQERSEDKLLKIEEAREKLAKAQQEVVRTYVKGQGFVYTKNMAVVAEAQSELNGLLKGWDTYQKKLELENQVKAFQDAKDKTVKNIDEEIERLKDLSSQWKDALDITKETEEYAGLLEDVKNFENASYSDRLSMLADFVSSWNSQISKMKSTGGGSGGSSGGSSSSSNSTVSSTYVTPWDANPGTTPKPLSMNTGYVSVWATNNARAGGTPSEKNPGLKLTGELGPELQVVNRGDGIITASITKNLMKWGTFDPLNMLSKLNSGFGKSNQNTGTINQFSFDNLVLPNVTDYNGFLNALVTESGSISTQVSTRRR